MPDFDGYTRPSVKNWILREYDDLEYDQKMIALRAEILALQEQFAAWQSRERVMRLWTVIFGGGLFFSLVIVILQGFKIGGFALDISTVNLLVGSTLGEIAGLLVIAYRWLYGKPDQEK